MIKHAACVLLLVLGNCEIANSAIVFTIRTDPGAGNNFVQIGPSSDAFTFIEDRREIDNNDFINPPIFNVPSLPPKSATDFEIIMDYFDGGLTQTLTNGGNNNLGLAFTSINLGNANGENLLLTLSNAEVLKAPPAEFYSWTTLATLNRGTKSEGSLFDETTQSREARVASIRATYSTVAGQNLFTFRPTSMTMEGNWYVKDDFGQVSLRISVVPEPGMLAVSWGACVGLCLFGRHRKQGGDALIA